MSNTDGKAPPNFEKDADLGMLTDHLCMTTMSGASADEYPLLSDVWFVEEILKEHWEYRASSEEIRYKDDWAPSFLTTLSGASLDGTSFCAFWTVFGSF